MMTVRVAAWIVWIVVVCMSIFGCGATDRGTHGNPGPQRVAELENGLRSKPSFEVARTEYVAATNQMATEIAALVPGMKWTVDENSWSGCGGEYVWTRAVQVNYRIVLDRAIPDDLWPKAVQIVKDGAARFGATGVRVFVDQPGNKDLAISGSGAQFHFGTKVRTVLDATSDCRMRATDTPSPIPTPTTNK
jgi:Lipoprotein confined to pathogenic Mycobacterium